MLPNATQPVRGKAKFEPRSPGSRVHAFPATLCGLNDLTGVLGCDLTEGCFQVENASLQAKKPIFYNHVDGGEKSGLKITNC